MQKRNMFMLLVVCPNTSYPLLLFQFINHLVNQLARHQFLKIACQLEKKTMLGAFSLLKVIESELQAYLSATKGRVVSSSVFFVRLYFTLLFVNHISLDLSFHPLFSSPRSSSFVYLLLLRKLLT